MKYEEERFRKISDDLQEETLRFIMDYKIRSEKIKKEREKLAKEKIAKVQECWRMLNEKHS